MPKSHTGRTMLDRRSAILAGTAFIGAAAIPDTVVGATEPGLAPAADFLAAVRKFLASLEPDKRKAATFAWNGPEWSAWNYFGVGGYIKPGLRLEQMSAEKAFGYRLIGDGFVIELGSVDPAAQHLHTIYNDLGSVLGRTA